MGAVRGVVCVSGSLVRAGAHNLLKAVDSLTRLTWNIIPHLLGAHGDGGRKQDGIVSESGFSPKYILLVHES